MSEVNVYKLFSLSTVSNNIVQWRGAGSIVAYNMNNNAIYSSRNISSVADEGVGYVTPFFTYPFTSLGFIVTGMASVAGNTALGNQVAGAGTVAAYPLTNELLAHSTNYMKVHVSENNTDAAIDSPYLLLSFHGVRI